MPERRPTVLVQSPKQERSRATQDALLQAFRRLLRARGFEAISVAEIAAAAGTSVGGFYARFATKEALLVPMFEELLAEMRRTLDEALDAPGVSTSLVRVIEAYVGAMVQGFREHRLLLQQLRQAVRGETGATLARGVHEFNVYAHERFRRMALAHRREIRHRAPKQAVEFALFIGSAAAREAVLSENWKSYEVQPDDATLVTEISRAMRRYLEGAGD